MEKQGVAIVGDIVTEWIQATNKHFGGPVKTIVLVQPLPTVRNYAGSLHKGVITFSRSVIKMVITNDAGN